MIHAGTEACTYEPTDSYRQYPLIDYCYTIKLRVVWKDKTKY